MKKDDISYISKELRRRLNLSQEKFAARLGVSFQTINRWENGKTEPSPLARKQLEDILRSIGKKGKDLLNIYFRDIEG
mgnify:CR=1 FL=1